MTSDCRNQLRHKLPCAGYHSDECRGNPVDQIQSLGSEENMHEWGKTTTGMEIIKHDTEMF